MAVSAASNGIIECFIDTRGGRNIVASTVLLYTLLRKVQLLMNGKPVRIYKCCKSNIFLCFYVREFKNVEPAH